MSVGIQTIVAIVIEEVCAGEGDAAGAGAFRAIPQTVFQVRAGPIVIIRHQVIDRDRAVGGDIQSVSRVITDEEVGTGEGHTLRCAEAMGVQGRAAASVVVRADVVHGDGAIGSQPEAILRIVLKVIGAGQNHALRRCNGARTSL